MSVPPLAVGLAVLVFVQTAVFAPLVAVIGVTALRNFTHWSIFRSRGRPYTHNLTWGVLALMGVTSILAACFIGVPWTSEALPGVAVLVVLMEGLFFYLVGVIITRQWVLALVFRTLSCRGGGGGDIHPMVRKRITPAIFIGLPFFIATCYLLAEQLPLQLNIFGVISTPGTGYIGYAYTCMLIVVFVVPAFANRRIPVGLFYDYRSNIFVFTVSVVLFVVVVSLAGVFLSGPANIVASRLVYCNLYIFLATVYTAAGLLRPALAVWRHDAEYLEQFDELQLVSRRDVELAPVAVRGSVRG